jgi:Ca2+-binding RTX toxin-like protein
VQLSGLLGLLEGWDGSSNPFGSGFLQLEQSGDDTLLQWDQNGATGGADWQTLMVLENTAAGDFTEANFVPAYHPDGSTPAGTTITGTPDDDTLVGTFANDTIDALGGNDSVFGGDGGDLILGGDGFDLLIGEAGDDVIEGGIDDDVLSGEAGNDQLSGQLGNDFLDGGEGDNVLDGGDGDDFLSGGLGADQFSGGAGTDTIRVSSRNFASTIATGTGSDTIELFLAHEGSAAITVTDFTPGAGGDVLQLSGVLSRLEGWDGNSNPFGSDFLRLTQDGANTLFEWDRDGSGVDSDWQTLMVLENTDAVDFTADNFVPGYDPDGDAPVGETITGTADDDTLSGTIGDDTIDALGGNDSVFGNDGADVLSGGDGFDLLVGQDGNDVIAGGIDDDVLSGEAGNDQLSGDAGSDRLFGGEGEDVLDGGDGEDFLIGNDGADVFHFEAASQGPDEISDFVSGEDQIRVSASGFGGGLTAGGTVSLVSGSDPVASGAGGEFLYDTDDGRLLWDADGTGAGAAVLFATLPNLPPLTASDFVVI